jgi:uncharacterized membrane protein
MAKGTQTKSGAAKTANRGGTGRSRAAASGSGRTTTVITKTAAATAPLTATTAAAAVERNGDRRYVPRWPAIVGLVLCVLGIAVAAYLTYAHYNTSIQLACPDKGIINCAKVTTSSYSKILGIPVALLGLIFFVGMLPLQTPRAWRSTYRPLRVVRLGSCVIGIFFVLWLVYAELIKIRNICLYCTSVHILTFALLISTAAGTISTSVLQGED